MPSASSTFSFHEIRTRARAFFRRPPPLLYVFLLVVFLELEESIQRAPTIRLLENAICQRFYRDSQSSADVDESLCKTVPIQSKLAEVRGILSFCDAIPVILLGSYFGSLADRKGRRTPFALAMLGIIGGMAWVYFVCSMWDSIPIEVVFLSSLFRLIGGGPNLAIALCYTMASDVSTDESRSKSFYRIFAVSLITDLISPPIASLTLRYSLWLPYTFCALSLLCTYPVLLRMPETLPKSRERDSTSTTLEQTGVAAYWKFFKNWKIMVGVTTVFLAQFKNHIFEVLLPYISVRFKWTLDETAPLLSVVSATNILIFLVLLPWLTGVLIEKAKLSSHLVNIFVARTSTAMLSIGSALLAAAPNIGFLLFALIIYATGFGVRLSILSVLTAYVSSNDETAQLYALVATTDAIATMIASPLVQLVWEQALQIGGKWIVLPFIVHMCVFLLAFGTSCLLREPKPQTPQDEEEEQDPLLVDGEHTITHEEALARVAQEID